MVHSRSALSRQVTTAAAASAFLVVAAAACGNPPASSSSSSSGDAAAAAAASASAALAPTCASGMRPDPSGACVSEAASAPEVVPGPSASAPTAARATPTCPEASSPDRVAAFDWVKELGVDAPLGVRLRGTSGAAIEVRLLANQVESELRTACAAMASELGSKGPFANAQTACQAAIDGLRATRTKLGTTAKVAVRAHPAVCPENVEAVRDCAKRCNGDDAAPEATCAGISAGKCPGTCDGACEIRPASTCDGTCLGQCESAFLGSCAGTCKGKCDGKPMAQPGECKGKCEGGCDSVAKGECKGRCIGGCQLHAAVCNGVCTGRCSVPEEDLKCIGTVKLKASEPECAAYCDVQSVHRMACGAAQVDARVGGAKDLAAAATYVSTIEKHLPIILKIEQQLKGHLESVSRTKGVVTDGLKAITESGSPVVPQLSACLFSYNKAAGEGAASLLESSRSAGQVSTVAQAK